MAGDRNALVVSILSKGWAAALSLLAIPFYVRVIGIEAYGVVGLFVTISILVGFLDLGLGPTLTRELARLPLRAGALNEGRDMARTFEVACAVVAALVGLTLVVCSVPVGLHWVQAQALSESQVSHALALGGVALALQWPSNLYAAGLAGLHRLVQAGLAAIVFGTTRVALTVAAVWSEPTLERFFQAQIASALLQVLGMRWLLWRALGPAHHRPSVRWSMIQPSLRFAGGVTGITFTSLILTQTDKLILSKTLPLEEFGVYVLAGTLATGLYMLIGPLYSVMYPRFSALAPAGQEERLRQQYHHGAQIMAALITPAAAVIAVFSDEVIRLWTGSPDLGVSAGPILTFLILGNAINGLMNIPFAAQMAHGWTNLAWGLNIVFIALLAPSTWWAAMTHGAPGGAAIWFLLNVLCLAIVPAFMHRRILQGEMPRWYFGSVATPVAAAAGVAGLASLVRIDGLDRLVLALFLAAVWLVATFAVVLSLSAIRPLVRERLLSLFRRFARRMGP